jgi:hypothetical protein
VWARLAQREVHRRFCTLTFVCRLPICGHGPISSPEAKALRYSHFPRTHTHTHTHTHIYMCIYLICPDLLSVSISLSVSSSRYICPDGVYGRPQASCHIADSKHTDRYTEEGHLLASTRQAVTQHAGCVPASISTHTHTHTHTHTCLSRTSEHIHTLPHTCPLFLSRVFLAPSSHLDSEGEDHVTPLKVRVSMYVSPQNDTGGLPPQSDSAGSGKTPISKGFAPGAAPYFSHRINPTRAFPCQSGGPLQGQAQNDT